MAILDHERIENGTVELDLAAREPFDASVLLAFLASRAIPGLEHWDGTAYHRTLALPHGHGVAEVWSATRRPRPVLKARLRLEHRRDLDLAVQRLRRLLDLDADPVAVDAVLAADPVLAPVVAAAPGRRSPGAVDPFEIAVRAVVGQQISVAGARTVAGRIVAAAGEPLRVSAVPELTHVFPAPAALAAIDPAQLPMPASRRRTITELATRVGRRTNRARRRRRPRRALRRARRRAGCRPVDNGIRADARARRSRRVPTDRLGRTRRARPPRRGCGARRTVATMALVRPPPPVGAAEGPEARATDAPRHDRHAHRAAHADRRGRRPARDPLRRRACPAARRRARRPRSSRPGRNGAPARRVLRRRTPGVRPPAAARRHRLPARRLAGAHDHPLRPHRELRRAGRAASVTPAGPGPSAPPTEATRCRSSCRATG